MNNEIASLFTALWDQYVEVTPSAERIHQLLGSTQDQDIVNDHIALRTFNHPKIGLGKLAAHFEALGYEAKGDYVFRAKKLLAKHYEHPDYDAPKVFISELCLEQCSEQLNEIVTPLIDRISDELVNSPSFVHSGVSWTLPYTQYQQLLKESEYAAWLAAWGFRANHFTVSVNRLSRFNSIASVNQALKEAGFSLNTAGGEIKGSSTVYLEQSSTMADQIIKPFSDQQVVIPSCFYEFAFRYRTPEGELFSGFVEASADRIFESTNKLD